MTIATINPVDNSLIKEYREFSIAECNHILEKVHQAFQSWREKSYAERGAFMKKAAQQLRAQVEEYARLMALEMGKPLKEGRREIEKCAKTCDYFADNAPELLANQSVVTDAKKSFVTFQPLGVVLAIMPWNFPFWQVFRFAAPALMAGNVAVLKHASNVPGCALAIEEIFKQVGFPSDVFRTLLIGSKQVNSVIAHNYIVAVTLTGSTAAGKAVASQAAGLIKKTVLELGGSDPYVVLTDADLEKAATICVAARLVNSGQSCIAAKRFIVLESVKKSFEELFVSKMQQVKMGDPLDENTIIGPQARSDLRDQLHQQVQQSIAKGARCLLGGMIPESKGAFYPPTVLTNVSKGMPAFDEELFGPVAAIISAKDIDEAIALANDTPYGLGAVVFTQDLAQGEAIATKRLQAGSCFVNTTVSSDWRLPFGGIKESGYGRELSQFGIQEFVNIKTVCIN